MLSFEQLTQNLTDTTQSSIVRSSAIAGLVRQGNPQGVQYLIDALVDADAMIRREAAKALQHLEATRATEPLLRALQTESNDLTHSGHCLKLSANWERLVYFLRSKRCSILILCSHG